MRRKLTCIPGVKGARPPPDVPPDLLQGVELREFETIGAASDRPALRLPALGEGGDEGGALALSAGIVLEDLCAPPGSWVHASRDGRVTWTRVDGGSWRLQPGDVVAVGGYYLRYDERGPDDDDDDDDRKGGGAGSDAPQCGVCLRRPPVAPIARACCGAAGKNPACAACLRNMVCAGHVKCPYCAQPLAP